MFFFLNFNYNYIVMNIYFYTKFSGAVKMHMKWQQTNQIDRLIKPEHCVCFHAEPWSFAYVSWLASSASFMLHRLLSYQLTSNFQSYSYILIHVKKKIPDLNAPSLSTFEFLAIIHSWSKAEKWITSFSSIFTWLPFGLSNFLPQHKALSMDLSLHFTQSMLG